MTFEELDKQQKVQEKNEQKRNLEKNEQFWLEKKVLRETSDLLYILALKISKEFGIDISEAKKLIRGDTSGSLDGLKSYVHNEEKINFSDFQKALSEAQDSIEKLSKNKRESLKDSLEQKKYSPEKFEYKINKKLFGNDILLKVHNPQNISDQVIGLGLGLIDSTEAVILFTYFLGKGVLLTPYHIYLLITGKAHYKGFSKI